MNPCGIGHIFIDHFSQPPGRFCCIHIQYLANMGVECSSRFAGFQLNAAAGKIIRIQLAHNQIGIGDCRAFTAAPVTGRARLGAGTFRANANLAKLVNMGKRAASCPDFDHINNRNGNRHARAFFKPIAARHFKHPRGFRGMVLDQADFCGCAAHIKG